MTIHPTTKNDSTHSSTESAVRSLLESILSADSQDVESFVPLAMVILNSDPSHIIPWRQQRKMVDSNLRSTECELWSSRLERYFHAKQQRRILNSKEQQDSSSSENIKERMEKTHRLYQQLQHSFQTSLNDKEFNHELKKDWADRMMNVFTWFIDYETTSRHAGASQKGFVQRVQSLEQQLGDIKIKKNPLSSLTAPLAVFRDLQKNVSLALPSSTGNDNCKYQEAQILRECILALEHIDGENICFFYPDMLDSKTMESHDGDETVDPSVCVTTHNVMMQYAGLRIRSNILPLHPLQSTTTIHGRNDHWLMGSGSMDALRICGEAGWLYHKIQGFIDSTTSQDIRTNKSSCGGCVARALASALQMEMETYQKFVASLEQQLQNPLETDLTSRRLWVQLRKPMVTLRSLALLADGISTSMGGGEILTAIYLHSLHGDTRHREIMCKMITVASVPWYDMLYDWIFHGILPRTTKNRMGGSWDHNKQASKHHYDVNVQDFFIEEDVAVDDVHMWQGRYRLKRDQVPNIPCMTSRVNLGTGSGYDASSLLGNAGVGAIIVDMDLATEALIVGKGINFIRICLLDAEWSMNMDDLMMSRTDGKGRVIQADTLEREQLKSCLGLRYNHDDFTISSSAHSGAVGKNSLRNTFSLAASQVHKYILESLLHQHHLIDHLRGLKDFLLLGQGDFISALIDTLYSDLESLGNPKEGLYLYHIQGIVQDALRSTNAAFLPKYILDNIGVKLMGVKSDRIRFWLSDKKYPSSFLDEDELEDPLELFTLDYSVHSPLAAVVYPTVLRKYHLIFSLLFRLKRIEWMLNRSWKQSRALFHALQAMFIKYASEIDGFSEHSDLEAVTRSKILMRKVSMTRQSMLHFLSNLQSYLMFEVLEVGWKDLLHDLSHSKTLDEIIKAHDQYLNVILKKSLLGDDSSLGGNYPSKMERQLRIVLTISYRFCKLHDWIFGEANQALEAAALRRRRGESRINAGEWGYEETETDEDTSLNMFTLSDEVKLEKVSSISSDFEAAIKDLLALLNDKINDGPPADTSNLFSPSVDSFTVASSSSFSDTGSRRSRRGAGPVVESDALQFLAYRLDFSDYYERLQ